MLSKEEEDFMRYWETYRLTRKMQPRYWLVGIPLGLLIGIPILINFSSGWYKRAAMIAGSQFNPMILVVALLLILGFTTFFYKQYEWERKEQYYQELKQKKEIREVSNDRDAT